MNTGIKLEILKEEACSEGQGVAGLTALKWALKKRFGRSWARIATSSALLCIRQ